MGTTLFNSQAQFQFPSAPLVHELCQNRGILSVSMFLTGHILDL